jgi:hypothetical protein
MNKNSMNRPLGALEIASVPRSDLQGGREGGFVPPAKVLHRYLRDESCSQLLGPGGWRGHISAGTSALSIDHNVMMSKNSQENLNNISLKRHIRKSRSSMAGAIFVILNAIEFFIISEH